MMGLRQFLFLVLLLFISKRMFSQRVNIDYPSFFVHQDMVNDTMTTQWSGGLFTGNGLLGNMVYLDGSHSLRMDVGRTDVYDHRQDTSGWGHLFASARLPIGHFLLTPVGTILKNTARLDVWNAEIRGTIVTDKGKIEWRTLTLSNSNCILFDYKTSGSEAGFSWKWQPEISISPRYFFKGAPSPSYTANPSGILKPEHGINTYRQPMSAGGGYTTAWTKDSRRILISVGYSGDNNHFTEEAIDQLHKLSQYKPLQLQLAAHRSWWHAYYSKSFLSIPDARMQSFYWLQLYKLASATRKGKPALDLQGPWTNKTPWPGYWFNLNMQLEYSPLYTSNHLEEATSLLEMIDKNAPHLHLNVPGPYRYNAIALGRSGGPDMLGAQLKVAPTTDATASEAQLELGDLTWLLYYYWLHYRYSMDTGIKEKLFPLLQKSTNYFLDVMQVGGDGRIHLPYSYSPEYPQGITRDCNYSLALFRWACQTLLKIAPGDSQSAQWKNVLAHLTDYPTDSTGLRIGRDVGFTQSHRHYSHLLMIYPLQLMNWEQPAQHELITQSLHTWRKDATALQGYSFTGGASIYEMMGNGNEAYQYLNQLLRKYVKPNTMYLESGPVIETPLAAAQTMQEMVLQCRDNKAFIFHAVPDAWKDVSFKDFRTEGAFLMSAVRQDGHTRWIRINSIVGGNMKMVTDMETLQAKLSSGKVVMLRAQADGSYSLQLKKGETIVLFSRKEDLDIPLAPVVSTIGIANSWGAKGGK